MSLAAPISQGAEAARVGYSFSQLTLLQSRAGRSPAIHASPDQLAETTPYARQVYLQTSPTFTRDVLAAI